MGKKASAVKVTYRNIKELKPYKKNAKKHPKEQVERIANSIKEFGFTQPVIIDKNNCVVAGHGRILGAKKAGLKQVPTVMLNDLTPEQIKAYRLVDNKLNESEWDYSLLDEELENLTEDIDMNLFGFDTRSLKDLFEEEQEVKFKVKPKHEVHIICSTTEQAKQVYETCLKHFKEKEKVEVKLKEN